MFHRAYSTILFPLFIAIFIANTFILQQPLIGIALLFVYLIWFGNALSAHILPQEDEPGRWWTGIFVLLSMIMALGSIVYYAAFVPAIIFQLIVLATPMVLIGAKKNKPIFSFSFTSWIAKWREKNTGITRSLIGAVLCATLSLAIFFHRIQSQPILEAVRSPWDKIDISLLALFAIASLITFTLLYRGRERILSLFLFGLLFLSLFSFAAIVYPIGYGFDSFIHKATETHLANYGTITPKPFYYIGQYTLVLFFSHAFSLPIDLVDTFLVPLLAALLLPLAWYSASVRIIKNPRHALFALIGLFLLPLDSFVITTPQSLANLWTLLVILASVPLLVEIDPLLPGLFGKERLKNLVGKLFPIFIGTIATMLIHPIAGIPIFFFCCLLALNSNSAKGGSSFGGKKNYFRSFLFWIVLAAGAVMLPASFIANAVKSGQGLHLNVSNLSPMQLFHSLNLDIFFQNRFSPLLDFVYLYGQNMLLIVFVVSMIAWWMYRKELSRQFYIPLLMILVLGVNYLLLANVIDFSFLIDYERSNYATRLLPLMAFFLSPFLILAIGHVSINIRTRPIILKLSLIVLATAIATSVFYLAYPRHDAYTNNHGFNVSKADVDAVYLIEDWAKGAPYITLANQSVSAAAMKNIGFRYFGNLFFYPIPTGDPMYQKFLAMNDTPNKKIVSEALGLIPPEENVHTLFYVVDTYWWEASRIIETAKSVSDDWKSVGGSVYVFRFDLK